MINSVMAGITKTKLYDKTANYYDWKEVYPQLKLLKDNIQDLKNDAKLIDTVRTHGRTNVTNVVETFTIISIIYLNLLHLFDFINN